MSKGLFDGRTISVVNDFSLDEQLYLYHKSREIKEAILSGGDVSAYRCKDGFVYLMVNLSTLQMAALSLIAQTGQAMVVLSILSLTRAEPWTFGSRTGANLKD